MSTLLLAAGESERFGGDMPKQHLVVNSERLIDRIIRQFAEKPPLLITHRDDICPTYGNRVAPSAHRYTAETVLSSKKHWEGNVLVLFTDMWFTDAAAKQIKDCKLPLAFFTDGHDIFGFQFSEGMADKMEEALTYVVSVADSPEGNNGRIWQVYRRFFGWDIWPIPPDPPKESLVFIGDETQDFDKMEEYEEFLAGKSKNVLCEAAKHPVPSPEQP